MPYLLRFLVGRNETMAGNHGEPPGSCEDHHHPLSGFCFLLGGLSLLLSVACCWGLQGGPLLCCMVLSPILVPSPTFFNN